MIFGLWIYMNIIYDFEKLGHLLRCFYKIMGVRYSLVDTTYEVRCTSNEYSDFCSAINATTVGHARCVARDTRAANAAVQKKDFHIYRCHAGILEAVLPIAQDGEAIAYLLFGQMLSNDDMDLQWSSTRALLQEWYPDPDTLKESFYKFKQLSMETVNAGAIIMQACSSYIWLDGTIKSQYQTDFQRLNAYIDANLSQPLSLAVLSRALSMSKTKLCAITTQQNTTPVQLITLKRINAAKNYLRDTDMLISEIAAQVGISDYNYFTKVFKSAEGMTPSQYRRQSLPKIMTPPLLPR